MTNSPIIQYWTPQERLEYYTDLAGEALTQSAKWMRDYSYGGKSAYRSKEMAQLCAKRAIKNVRLARKESKRMESVS